MENNLKPKDFVLTTAIYGKQDVKGFFDKAIKTVTEKETVTENEICKVCSWHRDCPMEYRI